MEGTLPWETPPPDEELPPCDRCQLDHRLAAKRAPEEEAYQEPPWRVLLGLRAGKAAWGLEPLDLGCARGDQDESCGYTHGGQSVHHGHGSLRLYVTPRRRRNNGLNVPSTPVAEDSATPSHLVWLPRLSSRSCQLWPQGTS